MTSAFAAYCKPGLEMNILNHQNLCLTYSKHTTCCSLNSDAMLSFMTVDRPDDYSREKRDLAHLA